MLQQLDEIERPYPSPLPVQASTACGPPFLAALASLRAPSSPYPVPSFMANRSSVFPRWAGYQLRCITALLPQTPPLLEWAIC